MATSCSFIFFILSCTFCVFSVGFSIGRLYQARKDSEHIEVKVTREEVKLMIAQALADLNSGRKTTM